MQRFQRFGTERASADEDDSEEEEEDRAPQKKKKRKRSNRALELDDDDLNLVEENTVRRFTSANSLRRQCP